MKHSNHAFNDATKGVAGDSPRVIVRCLAHKSSGAITTAHCVGCGIHLPIREPVSDESGKIWECNNCGYYYFAILDEDCRSSILANALEVTSKSSTA